MYSKSVYFFLFCCFCIFDSYNFSLLLVYVFSHPVFFSRFSTIFKYIINNCHISAPSRFLYVQYFIFSLSAYAAITFSLFFQVTEFAHGFLYFFFNKSLQQYSNYL